MKEVLRLVIRCSVQASHFTHASASRSGEMHHGGQSARRASKVAELTDLCEMAIRRAFFRSRCQRGTAVFAVACPFCGTQEKCGARQNLDDARRWMARGLPSSALAKFQRMFPVPESGAYICPHYESAYMTSFATLTEPVSILPAVGSANRALASRSDQSCRLQQCIGAGGTIKLRIERH